MNTRYAPAFRPGTTTLVVVRPNRSLTGVTMPPTSFPSVFSAASRQRTRHPVSFRFINSSRLAGGTPAALNRSFQSSLRVSRESGLFQSGPRCLETFSIPRCADERRNKTHYSSICSSVYNTRKFILDINVVGI
jgi:hypothetical protein